MKGQGPENPCYSGLISHLILQSVLPEAFETHWQVSSPNLGFVLGPDNNSNQVSKARGNLTQGHQCCKSFPILFLPRKGAQN